MDGGDVPDIKHGSDIKPSNVSELVEKKHLSEDHEIETNGKFSTE